MSAPHLLEFVKHYEYRLDETYLRETCVTPQEWWENKFGGR